MIEELRLSDFAPPALAHSRSDIDIAALVATYATPLFRVAFSILRNHAEAEDAVQDTFVRALEHRGALPAVRDMRVWLIRITWNLAVDRRRRIRPDQLDPEFLNALIAPHTPADTALNATQQMQRTLVEIDRLPKVERQALLLTGLEELTTAELAALMNKSESAVRAIVFRARARLRERLNQGPRP